MKKILLIGPPGSGKGTQATIIAQTLGIPTISTGHILREEVRSQSPLGLQIREIIEAGHLVDDQIMIKVIQKRLAQNDCSNGFILDGFPRTLSQALALTDAQIKLDFVFSLEIADNLIIERLSGRREHPGSGRSYHILYNPPKKDNIDDLTGEPLIQRKDDMPDNIKTRLVNFHAATAPVISYYREQGSALGVLFKSFDASLDIKVITQSLLGCFN